MSKKRMGEEAKTEAAVEETLQGLSLRLREKSPNGHRIQTFDDAALMENLHLTNAVYDSNLPGDATSERKIVAPLVAFFKRVIRKLTAWYIDPAMDQQRIFNASTTHTINEMKQYLDHIQINEDILSTIMHRDIALFRANVLFLNRYLERRMAEFEKELALLRAHEALLAAPDGEVGGNGAAAASDPFATIDILTLEQRVHGSPRKAKDRLRAYVPCFKGCENVLAIGCGRGELLQLFAQEGISVRGTETNPTLVGYCKDNELDVLMANPVDYLETLADGSLDGIILSRFAGHEPPARLVRMLVLCRNKLASGAPLVIETPNPFSIYVVTSYAMESSEQAHPLHPETLKQLCISYGFTEPQVMFLNPLPPEEHLEELELAMSGVLLDTRQKEFFQKINENFGRLNRILFSHRDYAIVTNRGGGDGT
ncbi:MAG: hypothetical protein CVT63_00115 [Candidatus Anoxymicrobium japonicum]|uniref:Class I SAM-dependent methyltransferase n=1 Tax=Candidatus Anoxymicrobium japonicum TaxID=2013648 RepID=A0A2N3G8A7_9ACTN|nr:MAG: hypothetical protein CVT63_00115 [Candidatus Anoxymicrobium japonicum]